MPRVLLCLAFVAVLVAGCSRQETPPELRWRFLGGQVLRLQTNAPKLREVLELPQAAALATPLRENAAGAWWNYATGGNGDAGPALAEGTALMEDLLQQLSIGEAVRTDDGGREFAIAIQLPPNRRAVWEKSWPAWIQAIRNARGGAQGGTPQVVQRDVWLLAVSDANRMPVDPTLRRLAAYPPVVGSLLQVDLQPPGKPMAQVSFVPTNGNVRVTASITTPQPLPTSLPAWTIPTFIREPLIQFTAIRGLGPATAGWLEAGKWIGGTWPQQAFVWGQPNTVMRFPFAAFQFDDPQNTLDQVHRFLQPSFAPHSPSPLYLGQLIQESNRLATVGSLPVSPVLQAIKNQDKGFLSFGVIPLVRTTNPPAPEMIAQMNKPNLLMYDLEIIAESYKQWNALLQIPDLMEGRRGGTTSPGIQWLLAAAPKLGECVTTATIEGERQLFIQRKSPVGLSGLELTALTRWLDPVPPLRRQITNAPATSNKAR